MPGRIEDSYYTPEYMTQLKEDLESEKGNSFTISTLSKCIQIIKEVEEGKNNQSSQCIEFQDLKDRVIEIYKTSNEGFEGIEWDFSNVSTWEVSSFPMVGSTGDSQEIQSCSSEGGQDIKEKCVEQIASHIKGMGDSSEQALALINFIESLFHPIEMTDMLITPPGSDTSKHEEKEFEVKITGAKDLEGEFHSDLCMAYNPELISKDGNLKLTFQFKEKGEVLLDVHEHLRMRRLGDEGIKAVVEKIVEKAPWYAPGMVVRNIAENNMKMSEEDLVISYRCFTFFQDENGNVVVSATRDNNPLEDQEGVMEAIEKSLRDSLSWENSSNEFAMNWGKMMVLPEMGGKAQVINALFSPQVEGGQGNLNWVPKDS